MRVGTEFGKAKARRKMMVDVEKSEVIWWSTSKGQEPLRKRMNGEKMRRVKRFKFVNEE